MDSIPDGNQTAHAIWDRGSQVLREQLSEATWRTWFLGVDALALEEGALVLGVPSSVALERIRASYAPMLAEAVREAAGTELEVRCVVTLGARVDDEPSGPAPESVLPPPADQPGPATTPWEVPSGSREAGGELLERYTFDQFVIGASNRFAHAAALQVAEAPARSYNPLFIYGPAGLGKTHLLHAIGHHVLALFPGKRVRYVLTESMMNEFVDAIRNNTMQAFKRRYREVDVLLLDDIQFLERSEQLREEFFHTFNALHAQNSQIVLSSDRAPKSIAVEDRLRSRFEWGLITDVQPPEFETRLAILRKKADAEHLQGVPDEVLAFIAAHVSDNVRELEGALIRVTAFSSLNRQPLSEDVARQVLSDLLPSAGPRVITPQLILDETAKMFGWTVEDLCGKSRRRPLTTARQIGMYVFRELTDFSYPRIAEEFGGRDHTTVMYAVEKIKTLMAERRQVFDQVNELITNVKHAAGGDLGGRPTGG